LADRFGGDGVGLLAGAVDVPDHGAGHVEGAGRASGLCTLGEVGAQRQGVSRQRLDSSGVAPAFPLRPDQGVDATSGLSAGCRDRGTESWWRQERSGRWASSSTGRWALAEVGRGGRHQVRHCPVVAASPPTSPPGARAPGQQSRADVRKG
jgi:hypothetical protein